MNSRHQLCALLLLAVWLPYYAHCVEPHCHDWSVAAEECAHEHHEEDHHHGHHDHGVPDADCHQHDPVAFSSDALKVLPPTTWAAAAQWLLAIFDAPPRDFLPVAIFATKAGPAPPLPVLLVCTALPVRGPAI